MATAYTEADMYDLANDLEDIELDFYNLKFDYRDGTFALYVTEKGFSQLENLLDYQFIYSETRKGYKIIFQKRDAEKFKSMVSDMAVNGEVVNG